MHFELPLKTIGSSELHEQVLDDIDNLIKEARKQNLKPFILVVGPLFIEIGSAQSLIQELKIPDWEKAISELGDIMKNLLSDKILSIRKMCESKNGMFASDTIKGINVFFDPDEPYMTLKCVDPATKGEPGEAVTKDGYLILTMKFRKEEILVEFVSDGVH